MTEFWKNKKIIAYIALAHHTRFITPVMNQLASKGARIKYIVGQAERSQEITAIQMGLAYAHIFDYVTNQDNAAILENYHILRRTFTKSLKNDFILGIMPVTVTDKTLFSTATEYIGFKNLIETEKPDLCFVLHEVNRWGKMFAFWAKKHNIPFITLHEGLMYGNDFGYSGHAQYATLNLVWGSRVKKKMVGFEAPASKIIPVGNTHLAQEIRRQTQEGIREKIRGKYDVRTDFVTLLILSSRLPALDPFSPVFKAVSQNRGHKIFVKFHPACKKNQIDTWVQSITDRLKQNLFFIHEQESTYDLISACDLVVLGQKSTTGMEALAFGKPLVKLNFAYTPNAVYSFVDQGVAIKMGADELGRALAENTDFSARMDSSRIRCFMENELFDINRSVERVCNTFRKVIQASQDRHFQVQPALPALPSPSLDWSLVVPVPQHPDLFLAQLEAIAVNSTEGGAFETLFLLPNTLPDRIRQILDSLEGDVTFIQTGSPDHSSPLEAVNQAVTACAGRMLLFFDTHLAPLKNWLTILKTRMAAHGPGKLFGARIADPAGQIAHAGIVVDRNHTPVCAYHRMRIDFEHALKERSFQMVDHFMAVEKELFIAAGGFTPDAGEYRFLDFCLKTRQLTEDPDSVLFLPDLQCIFLADPPEIRPLEDAIYFYSRWHGTLWESETRLYQQDGLSIEDITRSKLMAAM